MGAYSLNPEGQQLDDNSAPAATPPSIPTQQPASLQQPPDEQSQQPQQQPQDDQAVQQLRQGLLAKIQRNTQPAPQGGAVKRFLSNFISGGGQALMKQVGLPTPEEEVQNATKALNQLDQTQETIDYHKQLIQMGALQKMITPTPEQARALGDENLAGQQMPATVYQSLAAAASRKSAAETTAQSKVDVANITQGGGLQLPVDSTTAQLVGEPALAGKTLGKGGWAMLNSALQAKGYHVQDMGFDGPTGGMMVIDKAGNPVNQVSPHSLMQARGQSFATARAAVTPFETVEPGTNIPKTISNLEAVKTGAPRVSLAAQSKLGGQYALYNDAYGILDKIDTLNKQVNLDDPSVRARVTAGYAAIKDPASKGLTGEVLSNFLARQPINDQLQPAEREMILTMGQGKAAGMGLRSLLGQAGANEMQQRMDSALFPGGQALGSRKSVQQQVEATRGLLGRLSIGQPQAGLNAPNQPGSLSNRSSAGLTADEARGYLLKAGGDKDKARELARRDGRKF